MPIYKRDAQNVYRLAQKLAHCFVRLNFVISDRFSNLFHFQNQENIFKWTWLLMNISVWVDANLFWLKWSQMFDGSRTDCIYRTLFTLIRTSPSISEKLTLCSRQTIVRVINNTVTNDRTTPQVCRYTILWNANVVKATYIENKTTSVTTQFRVRGPSARRTHWTFDVKLQDK